MVSRVTVQGSIRRYRLVDAETLLCSIVQLDESLQVVDNACLRRFDRERR